ncbi:MAG: GntR family transcriptional regulator [Bacteroidetes bacterium]|nr:GntR family transcriptional regulator [Bacteroidota bacterium]
MIEIAYHKVYNVLREKILDKSLKAGEKIPPERILCETYGVSRITIRHALQMLQDQGLVDRMPGRGTFVRAPKQKKMPILDMDYEASLTKAAPGIVRKLITSEEILPPEEIMQDLGLLKSEQCLLIERLDILNNEPLSYDKGYIPMNFSSGIDDDIICRVEFLHLWEKRESLSISYVQSSTEAVKANQIDSERLDVPIGFPVLLTTEIFYSGEGNALAVFITVYRGDLFKLISTIEFKR